MAYTMGTQAGQPRKDFESNFDMGLAEARQESLGQFMAPIAEVGGRIGRYKVPDRTNINGVPPDVAPRASMGRAERRLYIANDYQYSTQPYSFESPYDPKDMRDYNDPEAHKAYMQQANALELADRHEQQVVTLFDTTASGLSSATNAAASTIEANVITGIQGIKANSRLRPNRIAMGYATADLLIQESTLASKFTAVSMEKSLTRRSLIAWFDAQFGLDLMIGESPVWTSTTTAYLFRGSDNPEVESYSGSVLTFETRGLRELYDYEYSKNECAVGAEWFIDPVAVNPYSIWLLQSIS